MSDKVIHHRAASFEAANVDLEKRTATLSFSSEHPYRRAFGMEVLDHAPSSVRMQRLNSGAPLLFGHDAHSQGNHIGVVQKAWLGDDRRGHAEVRFSRSAEGERALHDAHDGVLRNVSVGYICHDDPPAKRSAEGVDTFRFMDWEPFEVSLVTIPADHTVGIGREFAPKEKTVAETAVEAAPVETKRSVTVADPIVDHTEAIKADRERAAKLRKFADEALAQPGLKGRKAPFTHAQASERIDSGVPEHEFRSWVADRLIEAYASAVDKSQTAAGAVEDAENKEKRSYSVRSIVLAAIAAKMGHRGADIGFEREVSSEISKRTGIATRGLLIPNDFKYNQRAMVTTNAGNAAIQGIETVPEVIEIFRKKAKVVAMGARVWNNLHGIIKLPRQTSVMTDNWAAETQPIAISDFGFDFVELSPKRHGVRSQYTMELLAQSTPDIEAFIRSEMAKAFALGTDYVTLAGSGQNGQPTGIINTTGVQSVTATGATMTNGKALAYADILAFEDKLAEIDADTTDLGWMLTPAVRTYLKATQIFPGSASAETLYPVRPLRGDNGLEEGPLGYKAAVTNQLPKNLGAGTNLQALVFGDFSEVIVADWGAVEIIFDEITQAANGIYNINMRQLQDVELRHPQSFVTAQLAGN